MGHNSQNGHFPWIKGWNFAPEVAEMGEAVLPERGMVERGLKAEAPATRRRAQKNPPCIPVLSWKESTLTVWIFSRTKQYRQIWI
jgi:hypothetical protein